MDQSGRGVGVVGPGVQGVLRGVAQTASPLDDGQYHLVGVAVKQSDDVQSGCRNGLAAGDIGAAPTDLIVRQAAGSQDVRVQLLCSFMNQMLDAYGTTLDLQRPSYQRAGSDTELAELRAEVARGEVQALFVAGANPVYDLPAPRHPRCPFRHCADQGWLRRARYRS